MRKSNVIILAVLAAGAAETGRTIFSMWSIG